MLAPGRTAKFHLRLRGKPVEGFIVNMNGINDGVKLLGSPGYLTIVEDFKNTLAMQATYTPDIWVSSHAGQFNMHKLHKPGDAYNPAAFIDQPGYDAAINDLQKQYDEKMKQKPAIQ